MRTIVALTTTFMVLVSHAYATSWYVNSAGGSDSNNGKSLGTPFLTLQHAAGVTVAGDTVYVLPGVGYGGGIGGTAPLVISISGSGGGTTANTPCTSQITYQGYTGPFAPVSAPNSVSGYPRPIINGTQANFAIYGVNPISCITISYFEVAGWNGALTWAGVSANAGAGNYSTNQVYNGGGIGFAGTTGGTGTTSPHHIMMINNIVHDFPGGGIGCNFCDYVTESGNEVYNTAWYGTIGFNGMGTYEQHSIDAGTGTKVVVSNNIVFNNYNVVPTHGSIIATTTGSGTNTTGATTIVVASISGLNYGASVIDVTNGCVPPNSFVTYYAATFINISNPLKCNVTGASTIQVGYVTDGEGIIIDNNTNTQSDSVAYVGRTLVSNNIVFNNGSAGIQAGPASKNTDIVFNTIYENQTTWNTANSYNDNQGAELNDLGAVGLNIYNNVIIAATGAYVSTVHDTATSTAWSNNAIYGGAGAWSIPGSNNVTTDPMFVNPSINPLTANFQLLPGSPAIGAGSTTYSRITDIAGNPGIYGATPDIGAYAQPCISYGSITYQQSPGLAGSACRSR